MKLAPPEMVSIRDFRRESAERIRQLEECELEKLALMRHGKVIAVVLSVAAFEEIVEGK